MSDRPYTSKEITALRMRFRIEHVHASCTNCKHWLLRRTHTGWCGERTSDPMPQVSTYSETFCDEFVGQ